MKRRVNLPSRGKKSAPRPVRVTSIKSELAALKERELKLKRELQESAAKKSLPAKIGGLLKGALIAFLTTWSGR